MYVSWYLFKHFNFTWIGYTNNINFLLIPKTPQHHEARICIVEYLKKCGIYCAKRFFNWGWLILGIYKHFLEWSDNIEYFQLHEGRLVVGQPTLESTAFVERCAEMNDMQTDDRYRWFRQMIHSIVHQIHKQQKWRRTTKTSQWSEQLASVNHSYPIAENRKSKSQIMVHIPIICSSRIIQST